MEICNVLECTGCGACASKCPKKAIDMIRDEKGFYVPKINGKLCVNCGLCKRVCHVNSYYNDTSSMNITYAACAKNKQIRAISSSGGIVTILARMVFNRGGLVVGAVFDDNNHLYEDISSSWDDYTKRKFFRSKYVQSDSRDIFSKIQKNLNDDRLLMFVGTPCLCAALKTYLGRRYDNLIIIDFVCHGVPSPGVFDSYCKYLENKYKSKIVDIDFRVKKPSWLLSSTVYRFKNGKTYKGNMLEDLYNSCFANNNNNIRKSCNGCRYSCEQRCSDITVCDYWGKREITLSPRDDKYGVSAVIIHTEKGKGCFGTIKDDIIFEPVTYESVRQGNSRLYDGSLNIQNEEGFWRDFIVGKDWDDLKPYCTSWFEGVSYKTKFMMLYGHTVPIKLISYIKKYMCRNRRRK